MSSCPFVTFCNRRAGWLAPPQPPWAPALTAGLPRGTCAPNVLSAAEWEELSQPLQSVKISLVLRCSSACPVSREQPSVSAPSHKDSAGRWPRRRPTAPRAAQIPEIGNPQPPAHGANEGNEGNEGKPATAASQASGEMPETGHADGGQPQPQPKRANREKPAAPSSQVNDGKPQPHRNQANGEIPESAARPRGGSPPRASAADHREGGRRPPNSANYRVGEEGFEPSRPFGHTDLNRARLPFRHPPRAGSKASTTPSALIPRIRSDASSEGRCHGGSSAAL
jgi:hypothetical protein